MMNGDAESSLPWDWIAMHRRMSSTVTCRFPHVRETFGEITLMSMGAVLPLWEI